MFSNKERLKLKINNKKIMEKASNLWVLNNTLINIHVKKEVSRVIKYVYVKLNANEGINICGTK